MRTISHEELKQKLDRQDNFRLVMALAEWAYQAKHIPDSFHFATMREALASLGKAETHLLLGALILVSFQPGLCHLCLLYRLYRLCPSYRYVSSCSIRGAMWGTPLIAEKVS